jgi:imidazolonepropionase
VHGGNRAREFEIRLEGASYEEIARAGGGIVSTVTATRAASEAELLHGALRRVDAAIAEGVGTVEVKSGYGLDIETELKMLRVARALPRHRPVRVVTSFLGAHAVPAGAVDGFCEGIAFDTAQIGRVFDAARPRAAGQAACRTAQP